jgi:hypothetical protein
VASSECDVVLVGLFARRLTVTEDKVFAKFLVTVKILSGVSRAESGHPYVDFGINDHSKTKRSKKVDTSVLSVKWTKQVKFLFILDHSNKHILPDDGEGQCCPHMTQNFTWLKWNTVDTETKSQKWDLL